MATRKRTIPQTKIEVKPSYEPPPIEFYFYIGDRYYRRMQPVPYKYVNGCVKRIKNYLESIK